MDRQLLDRMPDGWRQVVADVLLPLRFYESGAQLLLVNAPGLHTAPPSSSACRYSVFDRIGNAQMISRIGIAFGGNTDAALAPTKDAWLSSAHLQGLRRLVEELLTEQDWAAAMIAVDLTDQLLSIVSYLGHISSWDDDEIVISWDH
jgi:phenol hydroxylase P1 protein